MGAIELSITLASPRPSVWRHLSDLADHANWMADAAAITFIGEQRRGVGTEMEVLTKVGPLRTIDVIVVTKWEEQRLIAVAHRGLVRGQGEFELADTEGGTLLWWRERLTFPWWLGGPVTAQLARPFLARIWRQNLARFRTRVEAGVSGR
jgi:uncharacterized protein YndB with AHSA1/START domain